MLAVKSILKALTMHFMVYLTGASRWKRRDGLGMWHVQDRREYISCFSVEVWWEQTACGT